MAAESPSASESSLPAPDPTLDHFARLGLEPRFDVDRDAIETAYLELSRRFHPDRFAGGSSSDRRKAMEHASMINEAYQTLRAPVRRAEYLVRLGGIDLDSSDPETGAPKPSQEFLMEMLERREQLDEALAADRPDYEGLRDGVEDEIDERIDAAVEALEGGDVKRAAFELMTRRYLQRYLDEIEGAEGGRD